VIDDVAVSFYLEAGLQVKEHGHGIRGVASARTKGFLWFLLIFVQIRAIRVQINGKQKQLVNSFTRLLVN
jgi:hypothetical protein